MEYPVVVVEDGEGAKVAFPGVSCLECSVDKESLGAAVPALLAQAVRRYLVDNQVLPKPCSVREARVALPVSAAARLLVAAKLREQGVHDPHSLASAVGLESDTASAVLTADETDLHIEDLDALLQYYGCYLDLSVKKLPKGQTPRGSNSRQSELL